MKVNPKNYEQVHVIADKHNLSTRELTSGTNGYPKNLRLCVVGFKSFLDAEYFADYYNGKVTSIRKRDGWTLSQSQNTMYAPFNFYDVEHDGDLTETHYTYDVWTYDIAVEFEPLRIRSLEDLADYLNSCNVYPSDVEHICDDNCWTLMEDEWHVCNDGEEQIVFNDYGIAVVTEYNQ